MLLVVDSHGIFVFHDTRENLEKKNEKMSFNTYICNAITQYPFIKFNIAQSSFGFGSQYNKNLHSHRSGMKKIKHVYSLGV